MRRGATDRLRERGRFVIEHEMVGARNLGPDTSGIAKAPKIFRLDGNRRHLVFACRYGRCEHSNAHGGGLTPRAPEPLRPTNHSRLMSIHPVSWQLD